MPRWIVPAALAVLAALSTAATAGGSAASARIIYPVDGATVSSPFTVVFGLSGMGVAPAGTQMDNTGHHHLVIDAELPAAGQPIPKDERHLHFGGGQTEAVIELPPGEHTLQLLLGDFAHVPHSPPVTSERITITVE